MESPHEAMERNIEVLKALLEKVNDGDAEAIVKFDRLEKENIVYLLDVVVHNLLDLMERVKKLEAAR